IDNATLTAIPSQRWQVVLYLNNNSAATINPVIECQFTNAGAPVELARANLPPIGGGQRVGLTIYGPQTNLFVNRADCRLAPPAWSSRLEQRRHDALAGERQVVQANAQRVGDGVADGGGGRPHGAFAHAERRVAGAVDEIGLDLGDLAEAQDRV